MVDTYLERK